MTMGRLERALARSAAQAGAPLRIETHHAIAWHSATFSGDRHELVAIAPAGEPLDRWLARMSALDITVPGRMVADLRVVGCERDADQARITIEGLTLAID